MEKPWQILANADPEIFAGIESELARQKQGLELIASENFASIPTMAAMASVLTNKYAEGRPHKRYYGGCEFVDQIEDLAIARACQVFGSQFANVQPHSGAQANAATMLALLEAGDSILGMDLTHGGHLTHGSSVNFSGRLYKSHFYTLNEDTGRIDYDQVLATAKKVRPKLIIAGASAYPRTIDFSRFKEIAKEVGAYLLVDMAHIAGLVAAGLHPSPVGEADVVTTTTHKTLRGPRGGLMLWTDEEKSVALNKGVFPGTQGGPLEHVIAAKAVCFKEALEPSFREYQQRVVENSRVLGEELTKHGFDLVSGGTDNHLVLIDLTPLGVSGKELEEALGHVEVTVNKNTVPKETRSPFVTSGLRIGTPAVTSRGMGPDQMREIASVIRQTLDKRAEPAELEKIKARVTDLATSYPLYPEWT